MIVNDKIVKSNFEQKIIYAILLLGIVLPSIQFFYNRSLWLDEAALALNIIHKNFIELFMPLNYHQVAPVLFVLLEKLFSLLLPNSEYGLRLLPLLSYWGSLYFFYRILKITIPKSYPIIFALSLFVLNSTLIYYSSEAKQYMSDVLVTTSIYYLILKSYKKEVNKYYLLGLTGTLSVFLSNIAPIVLLSGGLYLSYESFIKQREKFKYIAVVSFAWGIAFLAYYYFFIYANPERDHMVAYWTNVNGFMPTSPFNDDFHQFLIQKYNMITRSLLNFGTAVKYLIFGLYIIGVVILIIRKKSALLILLVLPIFVHLFLSAFKLYPFELRFILYAFPLIIIIVSFGLDYLVDLLFTDFKIERFRLLAVLIPLLMFSIFYTVYVREKDYIQRNIKEGDKIYLYYSAQIAFSYYSDIHYFNISAPIIKGGIHRNNNAMYLKKLKNLKGRNWLLFSHNYRNEKKYIIRQLDLLGYSKIDAFLTKGSSTYLYDFNN